MMIKMRRGALKILKAHAPHHSKRHVQHMLKGMVRGKTFDEAHREALRRVGK